jgi:hypothetical protein
VRKKLLAALPWAIAALALAAAAVFAVLWQQGEMRERERDEVRRAGESFVNALTNFSHETIVEDADRIRSFAVGRFEEEASVFFGARAIEAIQEAEAVSSGEIESLFVESVADDESSVFAVVSETITNAQAAEPQTEIVRLHVEMVNVDDTWKVETVEVLQSPGTETVLPGA